MQALRSPRPPRAPRPSLRPPRAAAAPSDGSKPAPRTPRKRTTRKKSESEGEPSARGGAGAAAETPDYDASAAADASTSAVDADIDPNHVPAPIWAGRRGGYTPFEFVSFSDDDVLHDITVTVAAPLPTVYAVWADRANYGEWFSLITQSVHHVGDESLASYFVFYAHGTLPPLELYATLKRDLIPNEAILERAVDGWDIAAGVFFAADETDAAKTTVTLRIGYALPAQLADAVGAVAVYGDVEEMLRADMAAMAAFVEEHAAADGGAALAAKRAREKAAVEADNEARYGLPEEEGLAAIMAAPGDALYDAQMAGAVGEGVGPGGVMETVGVE